jgi:hypothetical protein
VSDISDVRTVADMAAAADAGIDRWSDLEWRLDNVYWIVDKAAKAVPFRLNGAQRRFIRNLWHRNLILKCRQRGFSTLMQVLQLDQALFNTNHTGVVIADTLLNASKLFGKIEFAYGRLPDLLRQTYEIERRESGSLLSIKHETDTGEPAHSTISVSVSSRGGTVQLLHVSELGKISLKFPQRAEEIRTGAIPSVPTGADPGCTVIESTAEGAFGLFWELCEPAMKRWHAKEPETSLDWRLHFFPWYEAKEYALSDEDTAIVQVPPKLSAYFRKLEAGLRITLSPNQRAWYVKESESLKGKMKQEYPSTPEEAFEQAIDGAVLGEQMTWLRENERLGVVPLDPTYPVNTFWDFGTGATNAIWFHQRIGLQNRWFFYISGDMVDGIKGLRYWWHDVLEVHRHKYRYRWGLHVLPHDADAEILGEVPTTKRRILESLGMGAGEGGRIIVVARVQEIHQGIEIMRTALVRGNHWFDKRRPDTTKGEDMGAGHGIASLDGYQFTWDDRAGVWSRVPYHNWASHGSDAWRQYAQAEAANQLNFAAADGAPSQFAKFANRPRRGI